MTMATKAACVLAVWVLVASGLCDLGSARAPLGSKPQREFDYFALSLQWPGTICASTRHCCATNGCCRYVLRAVPRRRPVARFPHLILPSKRLELAARPVDQFSAIRFRLGRCETSRPSFCLSCPAPPTARSRSRRSRSVSARPFDFCHMFRQVNTGSVWSEFRDCCCSSRRAMAGLRRRDLAVVLPPHPIRDGQGDCLTHGLTAGCFRFRLVLLSRLVLWTSSQQPC